MKLITDDGRVWDLIKIDYKLYEKSKDSDYPFIVKEESEQNTIHDAIIINKEYFAPSNKPLGINSQLSDEEKRLRVRNKGIALDSTITFYQGKLLASFEDIESMANKIYNYLIT